MQRRMPGRLAQCGRRIHARSCVHATRAACCGTLAIGGLAAWVSPANAQATRLVRGIVVDTTQHAVAGVNITLAGEAQVVSDDSGRFSIRVPNTLVIFDIKRLGFMPARYGVRPGRDTTIRVMLLPAAQQLAGVDVTAKASDVNGFADRMQAAKIGTLHGTFITADDIAKRDPTRVTDMFGDVPGVGVTRYGGQYNGYVLTGRQMQMGSDRALHPCLMSIYVDGARIGDTGMRTTGDPGRIDSYDFNELVQPTNVAGIEVYESGNDVPAKYQTLNGGCGVVLIWSKHGNEKSP